MTAAATSIERPARLSRDKALFLVTALTGSVLINLTAQFAITNLADIQGALGATADEASWLSTAYLMATVAGVVASVTLIRTFGAGRYFVACALLFASSAWVLAMAESRFVAIAARAVQGFAAGGFGPIAFVAVFTTCVGQRLPFGLSLLAMAILVPGVAGSVLSGLIEDAMGWRSLFLIQFWTGAALAMAGLAWLPRAAVNWPGLRTDWIAIALLCTGLSTLILIVTQGTRHFWLDSDLIVWAVVASGGAWAGFAFLCRWSPLSIISIEALLKRKFGVPILFNLFFRAGLVVTAYLIPVFLVTVHGYRPLQLSGVFAWSLVPQFLVFPLVWRALHWVDSRVLMGAGLALCGVATALAMANTNLVSGEQFRFSMILFGMGQVLFLVPTLLVGAMSLKPAELPTASIVFNVTTVGGGALGVGILSHFVTEREKFHSNVLTEGISLYRTLDADRISAVSDVLGGRTADAALATLRAIAMTASGARREAWVLAFNDGFLLTSAALLIGALGVVAVGRCAPLIHLNHISESRT